MGNAALDSADYERAEEYYMKAIEVDSMHIDAYHKLGSLYLDILDYDSVIKYSNMAIEIDYNDAYAWNRLVIAYALKNDFDSAIELFKKHVAANPDSPHVQYHLGWLYMRIGNHISAMRHIRRAAQLGSTLAQEIFTYSGTHWDDSFIKPDYGQIKQNIENKESEFYYPVLFEKYLKGDERMTLDEYRHLYYGYVFNENYSPYADEITNSKINEIIAKEKPAREELERLVLLIDTALNRQPFNIAYLWRQSNAYDALNMFDESRKNEYKIYMIINTLNSTGDGLTKETAIHVISVASEYDYLFKNKVSAKSQALVDGGYDVLYLDENIAEIKEMWFDISQPFGSLSKFSKEQPEKRRKERRRR